MAQFDHLAIEIRTDDPLALNIKNKLDKLHFEVANTNTPHTIFRVPSYIREFNKNFYEPRIVSIGPYHRDREHLKCMEEQKLWYVRKFLSQNNDITLNKYLEVLRGLELVARRCYYEKIDMDSDQFVEMLLFDACFIIQLAKFQEETDIIQEETDIIYDIGWNIPLIKSDLLMLENQIPFFVLQRVFDLHSGTDDTYSSQTPSNLDSSSQESEIPKPSLSHLLVTFLQHKNEPLPLPEADQTFGHLLGFYYHSYMSSQKLHELKSLSPRKVFPLMSTSIRRIITMRRRLQMIANNARKPRMVPCATELRDAGITFKKAESKSIFNVKFSNGVLTIPYTSIDEATRPQLMNLIAFEQCISQKEKPLTSYAVFMDCIVNTSRDVLILQQHEIIENTLADEKAAAEFFNQLRYCSYLDYEEHHLATLFKKVKKYCDSRLHKYRAHLYREYFSNPWSIISFLAAIMFLFLSTVQTLYSVLSYYRSSN